MGAGVALDVLSNYTASRLTLAFTVAVTAVISLICTVPVNLLKQCLLLLEEVFNVNLFSFHCLLFIFNLAKTELVLVSYIGYMMYLLAVC